jgi:hypothetical protein
MIRIDSEAIPVVLTWLWSKLFQAWLALDVQFWTSDPRQPTPARGALTRTVYALCHDDIFIEPLHFQKKHGVIAQ